MSPALLQHDTLSIAQVPGFRPFRVQPDDAAWWFEQHDRYAWRFAKTMPFAPHSYIWRDKEMTTDDYDRMFGAVKTFGEPGKYWDRAQLYLINHERDIRYWLMDRHYYTCTILNMATDGRTYGTQDAPITRPYDGHRWSEYDAIAPWWDDAYRQISERDRAILWKLVHRNVTVAKASILDLGAGTGGTLDAKVGPSRKATVVDPSTGMLNDLALKYPDVGDVYPGTVQGYLEQDGGRVHDLVIASFGSASYLSPQEITGAHERTGMLTILSFYGETPPHRHELPPTHDDALAAARDLPGAVTLNHGPFVHVCARAA